MMDGPTLCASCGGAHGPQGTCSESAPQVVLGGKYQLLRLLGEGGMGKVFEARHLQIGRRVAVKFLRAEFARRPEVAKRFENEARAAGSLSHENIAVVHDFGLADDGSQYLVMELLQGQDCASLLRSAGPLSPGRAVDLVMQACRGLAVAHRHNIVHRDLKPPNLFVCQRGDGSDLVKILDFGVAKLRFDHGGSATAEGQPIGTAHYMAPEQARGERSVDQRADIYALGIMLYEFLTGRLPFEATTPMAVLYRALHEEPPPLESLRPGVDAALIAVVKRAMARDPALRFSSAVALLEALAPFADGGSTAKRQERAPLREQKGSEPPIVRENTSPPLTRTTPDAFVGPSTAAAPRGRPGAWRLGLASAVVVAIVLLLLVRRPPSPSPSTSASTSSLGVAGPAAGRESRAPSPASAETPVVARAPADASNAALGSVAPPSPAPSAAEPKRTELARRPSLPAVLPVKPAAGSSNCEPNYYLDAKGRRHFKPECF
jgi:serine/threonine-protein kinase